jgi:hypothetical protein
MARHLLGGWTITGLTSILSGEPINIAQGTDVALDGTGQTGLQHSQLAPGVTHEDIPIDHSSRSAMISEFFNTAAFVHPNDLPRGIYGNAGRNLISGPAAVNTDLAVMKNFLIREPLRLQFRGELFNAFNQVNFSDPQRTVVSGSFGRITNAGAGRQIQLAVKLIW